MKRFIALLLVCVMSFGILSVSAEEPVNTEEAVEVYAEETEFAEPAVESEEESAEAAVLTAEEETEEEVSEVTEPEETEPEVTEPEVTEPEVTEPGVTEPEVTEPEETESEVTESEVTESAAETEEETAQPQEQEEETTAPEEEIPAEPVQEEIITPEEQDLSTEETEGTPETDETAEETPESTEPEETIEVLNTKENGWEKDGDDWYYYVNGSRVTGWKKISGYYYYFDYNGRMYCDQLLWENGYYYRFDKSGHMVTGWYEPNEWDKYYYRPSGAAANGPFTVDGIRYCFDSIGRLLTGVTFAYTDTDGIKYLIRTDDNGVITDQVKIKENGWTKVGEDWFYYEDGEPAYGWRTIGGYRYYFEYNGRMSRNTTQWIEDSSTGTYNYYYFDNDGHLRTGWF